MNGGLEMPNAVAIFAHPDDELYTMWPMMHLLGNGYNVQFVFATRGEVTPASLKLDPDPTHYAGGVQPVCSWPDHNYKHDPARENFVLPTTEQIGLARLAEGKSCIGAMASIPPGSGVASTGLAYAHDENMGSQYGCGGCASSTAPVIPEAVDAAEVVIRKYIQDYPNSFFYTHSPTDAHPDHAALGMAMRRLKGSPVYHGNGSFTFTGGDPVLAPLLVNAQFFVSKLYWSTPLGQPGSRLNEYCAWYPNYYPQNSVVLPRRAEYTAWLKTKVAKAYQAWNPAEGSFAIGGGHSTYSQMFNCITNPDLTVVSALWHP